MKKFYIIILAFSICLFSCVSNKSKTKTKNSLTLLKLNGKVKTFKVDKTDYYSTGDVQFKTISSFNENGYTTEYSAYFPDIPKNNIILRYIYDDKGNEIERDMNGNNGRNSKSIYKFDNRGNEIEENVYISDNSSLNSKTTLTYDSNNNLIEQERFNSVGNLDERNIYKYDENNNRIEENSYSLENGKLIPDYTMKIKCDNNGNEIENSSYNSEGILTEKNSYKYDTKGNEIESDHYYGTINSNKYYNNRIDTYSYKYDENKNLIEEKSLQGYFTYTYEFDKNNNWIKRKKFDINEKLEELILREIDYY